MKLEKAGYALLLVLMLSACSYYSKFSDRELEERFRSNEAEFNRLVQMLKEDSQLSRVSHEAAYLSYDVKASLPQHRFDDYRTSLSKLKVTAVYSHNAVDQIYFAVWNKDDFLPGGTNEYFVYAETGPAENQYIVESLDTLRRQTDAYAFKRIADRWYLHVDNW